MQLLLEKVLSQIFKMVYNERMQLQRRALYNSLRMRWIEDSTLGVEPWQVENYRKLSLDLIFDRLHEKELPLDRVSFLAFADTVDTPEDFTDEMLADTSLSAVEQDQVYLLVFELWRRLKPEKPCLSIFCDEMDYQIHLYDLGETEEAEAIQDILANLKVILDENIDHGANPKEAFEIVADSCANDIESFLYDFISEQIDNRNISYASDLIDAFFDYVSDVRWFKLLKARILAVNDPVSADVIVRQLVQSDKNPDMELCFDLLAFMVQNGTKDLLLQLVKRMLPLLKTEEDFQDLLTMTADFYHCLDNESIEKSVQNLLSQRSSLVPTAPFHHKDPAALQLLKILAN